MLRQIGPQLPIHAFVDVIQTSKLIEVLHYALKFDQSCDYFAWFGQDYYGDRLYLLDRSYWAAQVVTINRVWSSP